MPFIGMAALAIVHDRKWILLTTLATTLINVALALYLWISFDLVENGMQFVERADWMPTFGIQYAVGVDERTAVRTRYFESSRG